MNELPYKRPRLAVAYPGDATDPAVRSGAPHGVLSGLHAQGFDVLPIDVRGSQVLERVAALAMAPLHQRRVSGSFRHRLRRGYSSALLASPISRWRSVAGTARLSRLDVSAVVQLGAGYLLHTDLPHVVYDDMTIIQALGHPYPGWQSMRRGDVAKRISLQAEVYRRASAVCVESSWAARSVIDDYGVPRDRVHIIGTASSIEPRSVSRTWSPARFLFVGLDYERKNGPMVLRAFEKVRLLHPGVTLDVVGGHPPLHRKGVRGHGVLPRNTDEGRAALRALFDSATCFVMPSRYEPAGVVFTEAAAAGIPSIGGTVGGSADLIGEGGMVVDPDDELGLVEAMLHFCDAKTAQRTGAAALARAPELTWPALAQRLSASLGLSVAGPVPLGRWLE